MNRFSHFNEQGRAQMVDISEKSSTVRTAAAVSSVHMKNEVYEKIQSHDIGKGDVLAVAQGGRHNGRKANVQYHSDVPSAFTERGRYIV